MNKNELLKILKEFPTSKDNIILLDGKRGSGKTYLLNEYIKGEDRIPIYYVSLLAKRNIDDINTALYKEVNKDQVITSTVPVSVSPFNLVSSLDYTLKINNSSNAVIILDDLERYGSSNYKEFQAYLSSLSIKGVKIICVSNLSFIGAGERYNFDQYKEKIFDRIYKCDLFSNDLLKNKLGEFYEYFDDNLISLFSDNIRIVDKTYVFLNILKPYFDTYKIGKEMISSIIFYSILTITTYFNDVPLEYPKLKEHATYEEKKELFSYINDEDSRWEALKIYEFSLNIESNHLFDSPIKLIAALYEIYVYGVDKLLVEYFNN